MVRMMNKSLLRGGPICEVSRGTLAGSLNATVIPKERSTNESSRKTGKILSFIQRIVVNYIKAVRRPLTEEDEEDLQGLSI
jgi:hypothetical protein